MTNVQSTTARNPLVPGGATRSSSEDPFKQKIAQINKYFGDRPEERDRRIMDALVDWAGPAPEPEPRQAWVEIDPVTGVKYVDMSSVASPMAEYERALQSYKMGQTGVITPHALEERDRRQGLQLLTAMGGKVPPKIERSNRLLAAINNVRQDVPVLDVHSLDPDGIEAAVTDYVDSKMRAEAARAEYQRIAGGITGGFIRAVQDSVSDVLADRQVRKMFDTAAKSFTEHYPAVSDCHTLEDAARKDESGAGVAAWNKVQAAVRDMTNVVTMVAHFAAPERKAMQDYAPARRLHPSAFLGLSAAPPADVEGYLSALAEHGIDGTDIKLDREHVFGIFGAQMDAGCVLSLPVDADDLRDRRDGFDARAIREQALINSAGGVAFGLDI